MTSSVYGCQFWYILGVKIFRIVSVRQNTFHNSSACHANSSSESRTPKERAVWSNSCFHEQLFTGRHGWQTKSCAWFPWSLTLTDVVSMHGVHTDTSRLCCHILSTDWQDVWTEMGWDVFESTLAGLKAGTIGTGIAYRMLRPAHRYLTSIKGLAFNCTFSWSMLVLSAEPAMQEIPAWCPLQKDPTNQIMCLALGYCQGSDSTQLEGQWGWISANGSICLHKLRCSLSDMANWMPAYNFDG